MFSKILGFILSNTSIVKSFLTAIIGIIGAWIDRNKRIEAETKAKAEEYRAESISKTKDLETKIKEEQDKIEIPDSTDEDDVFGAENFNEK